MSFPSPLSRTVLSAAVLALLLALPSSAAAQNNPTLKRVFSLGTLDWTYLQVNAAGDIDGDGIEDLMLEEPAPRAWKIVSGAFLNPLSTASIASTPDTRLTAINDLDGDGLRDLVKTIRSAPAKTITISTLSTRTGAAVGGTPVTVTNVLAFNEPINMGDADGDGIEDIAILYSVTAGSTFAIYSGANLTNLLGPITSAGFSGTRINVTADVTGDGKSEIAITLKASTNPAFIRIFDGATGATVRDLLPPATSLPQAFGSQICGVGDVNGDGKSDLMVVDKYDSTVASRAGAIYVYSVADGQVLSSTFGAAANENLGAWAVCMPNTKQYAAAYLPTGFLPNFRTYAGASGQPILNIPGLPPTANSITYFLDQSVSTTYPLFLSQQYAPTYDWEIHGIAFDGVLKVGKSQSTSGNNLSVDATPASAAVGTVQITVKGPANTHFKLWSGTFPKQPWHLVIGPDVDTLPSFDNYMFIDNLLPYTQTGGMTDAQGNATMTMPLNGTAVGTNLSYQAVFSEIRGQGASNAVQVEVLP